MGQIRPREIQWHGFSVRTGTGRKRKFGVPVESFRKNLLCGGVLFLRIILR